MKMAATVQMRFDMNRDLHRKLRQIAAQRDQNLKETIIEGLTEFAERSLSDLVPKPSR